MEKRRAVSMFHLLPSVVRLVRLIHDNFYCQFSREEVSSKLIGEFIRNNQQSLPELRPLTDDFIIAWNVMASEGCPSLAYLSFIV